MRTEGEHDGNEINDDDGFNGNYVCNGDDDDFHCKFNFDGSSIDVGGGDHFGGADPDATPLDDGEVNIVTISTITTIAIIINNVSIPFHGQTLMQLL